VDEFHPEGLHAGQEVVPAGTRDDQGDIGADAQDVAGGREEAHVFDGPHLQQTGVRRHVLLSGQPLGIGHDFLRHLRLGILRHGRRVGGIGDEHSLPAPQGLGQTEEEIRQHEGGHGQYPERQPPGEGGDISRHCESQAGSDQLTGQDEAVDPPALSTLEVVADERCHNRAGRAGNEAQCEPGEQELPE